MSEVDAAWSRLLGAGGDVETLAPRLAELQRRAVEEARPASLSDHGPPRDRAATAIVTVLHHRLDLLEHQLAAFAADPDARVARIVCVIDGPGLAAPAVEQVPLVADLYGTSMRLVVLQAPGGRAVALGEGAAVAEADTLVLMQGDAIPTVPGWLGALRAAGSPAAPILLDEHDVAHPEAVRDEPCLLVEAQAFADAGGLGTRFPGGFGAVADLARRLGGVRRVDGAIVHWLGGVDEPTLVPEARRYGAWLTAREEERWQTA